jgi:hypothetical protein
VFSISKTPLFFISGFPAAELALADSLISRLNYVEIYTKEKGDIFKARTGRRLKEVLK